MVAPEDEPLLPELDDETLPEELPLGGVVLGKQTLKQSVGKLPKHQTQLGKSLGQMTRGNSVRSAGTHAWLMPPSLSMGKPPSPAGGKGNLSCSRASKTPTLPLPPQAAESARATAKINLFMGLQSLSMWVIVWAPERVRAQKSW